MRFIGNFSADSGIVCIDIGIVTYSYVYCHKKKPVEFLQRAFQYLK